ncbi:Ketosteroid isomerase-related protein [Roseovarius litoreus]|uniref:Ketosteroid isomerase-related protein n=1 Tax=Roseovarius litoreus TaxID=1155722 RepID=A0A1M7JFF9_9RHOB|nr:nuclear transport factor 2 family protein [Roseovarius litoreus]SHM51830.1 Ketosteroid isomerase-related protein [Roseovarius litoreus]
MIGADEMTPKDEHEVVVLRWFTSLMRQDLDAFADLLAEDAVQEMPFGKLLEVAGSDTEWAGKDGIISYFRKAIPGRRIHIFIIKEFHRTADPEVIIVEAHCRLDVVAVGKVCDKNYVMLDKLRDGKSAVFREDYIPRVLSEVFGRNS